jgi:hypothetical protein
METRDTVEGSVRRCISFSCQDMDVGMEIDAVSEGLDRGRHSWLELAAADCMQ